MTEVYVGPIRHASESCYSNHCNCWCQACERGIHEEGAARIQELNDRISALEGDRERLRSALASLREEVIYRNADGTVRRVTIVHGGEEHSEGTHCLACAALDETETGVG